MTLKSPPLTLVFLLFSAFIAFFSLFSGYESVWNLWNIPVSTPHFEDVRMMTVSSESHALGYDPLFDNPQEPNNKKLNYPRIWHALFALEINQNHTQLIGAITVLIFFLGLGCFMFAMKPDKLTALIITFIVLSPSVMLGIERGNIELIIFFVLSIALILTYYSSVAALSIFIFASFLKLYPVFSFIYLLKEGKRRFWILFLSAISIFSVYILYTLNDLKQVYLTSPKLAKSSYGLNVFWMGLTHPRILAMDLSDSVILFVKILSYVLLGLIFTGALLKGLKSYDSKKYIEGKHLDSFRVGASIYIGCFILGNNFVYRFTFLIFTIPLLVSLLKANKRNYSMIPLITLSAIIFSCWNYDIQRVIGMKLGFLLVEMSNWILLSGILYLFIASLPEWFMDYLCRPFSRLKCLNEEAIIRR